jgi:hypothetical protein
MIIDPYTSRMARHRRPDLRTRRSTTLKTLRWLTVVTFVVALLVVSLARPALAVVISAAAAVGAIAYDTVGQRRASRVAERRRDDVLLALRASRDQAAAEHAALRAELEVLRVQVADGRDRLADVRESATNLAALIAAQDAELARLREQLAEISAEGSAGEPDRAPANVAAATAAAIANGKTANPGDDVAEIWPDLADAPTVVDLLAWDSNGSKPDSSRARPA